MAKQLHYYVLTRYVELTEIVTILNVHLKQLYLIGIGCAVAVRDLIV